MRTPARILLLSANALAVAAAPAAPQDRPPPVEQAPCADGWRMPLHGVGDPMADFGHVAELAGRSALPPRLVRRASDSPALEVCADSAPTPWRRPAGPPLDVGGASVSLLPVRGATGLYTSYPRDRNNGALWEGRGLYTRVRGGAALRWGPVSAALAPDVSFHENVAFDLAPMGRTGYSPYISPGWGTAIDWPQRFGATPFWTLDPGQSYVRLDAYGVGLGLSTANLWWGPALRYPILMSNTAPGFPHLFVGPSAPVDIGIGALDGDLIWGRLAESAYFDGDPVNDRRLFAGLAAEFEPRGLDGLSLGFARAFLVTLPPDGLSPSEYLLQPYTQVLTNRSGPAGDNQLFSFFARWLLPDAGFEAYAEWARDDHWADIDDLLMEPDHSQAFLVGFQKVIPYGERWLRLYGELVSLGAGSTIRSGRTIVHFYTHAGVRQGYTNRGQLLGAAVGPTSDAQILGGDLFSSWGRIGGFVERVRYDNTTYYDRWAPYYGYSGHDLELTAGVRQLIFLDDHDLDIVWRLSYSHRWNRKFIGLESLDWTFRTDRNIGLRLGLRWYPRRGAREGAPEVAEATGPGAGGRE